MALQKAIKSYRYNVVELLKFFSIYSPLLQPLIEQPLDARMVALYTHVNTQTSRTDIMLQNLFLPNLSYLIICRCENTETIIQVVAAYFCTSLLKGQTWLFQLTLQHVQIWLTWLKVIFYWCCRHDLQVSYQLRTKQWYTRKKT